MRVQTPAEPIMLILSVIPKEERWCLTIRVVNSDKLAVVEDYAKNNENLESYAKGLGFNIVGGVMSCPFHGSDSTPSLRINDKQWKCFGCGRGGGYLKFREAMKQLESSKVTYYDVAEEYVHETRDLALLVGGTLYKSNEETMTERWNKTLEVANSKTYRPKSVEVRSYDMLIKRARHKSSDTKIKLLAAIQEDMPYPILSAIVNGTDLTGKSLMDLAGG